MLSPHSQDTTLQVREKRIEGNGLVAKLKLELVSHLLIEHISYLTKKEEMHFLNVGQRLTGLKDDKNTETEVYKCNETSYPGD